MSPCGVLWCSLECTPACQAGGRGFKSRQDRRHGRCPRPSNGRVAQLVERAPEKREVTGSTPVPTTRKPQCGAPHVQVGAPRASRPCSIRAQKIGMPHLTSPATLGTGHPQMLIPGLKWLGTLSNRRSAGATTYLQPLLCAISQVPGGLDCCGLTQRLPPATLESLDHKVRVHHVRRSPDFAEIGFDRYHASGFAQWCQFSVWGDGGKK